MHVSFILSHFDVGFVQLQDKVVSETMAAAATFVHPRVMVENALVTLVFNWILMRSLAAVCFSKHKYDFFRYCGTISYIIFSIRKLCTFFNKLRHFIRYWSISFHFHINNSHYCTFFHFLSNLTDFVAPVLLTISI